MNSETAQTFANGTHHGPDQDPHHSRIDGFAEPIDPGVYWAADFAFEPHREAPHPERAATSDESDSGDEFEEYEENRDLQGCKHVQMGHGLDSPYIYAIPQDELLYHGLKDEDEITVEADFRNYIGSQIPAGLLLDAYGKVVSIEELSQHQLAQMQAKLWRELPRIAAAGYPPPENTSRDDAKVADVIDCIAKKLSGAPHVIVLRRTREAKCNNLMCNRFVAHPSDLGPYREIVAVEPLLNMGFVVPSQDPRFSHTGLFVFRRNEDKYDEKTVNIDKYLSDSSTIFCVGCFQFLWSLRVRAWAIVDMFCWTKTDTALGLGQLLDSAQPFTGQDDIGTGDGGTDDSVINDTEYVDDRAGGRAWVDGASDKQLVEDHHALQSPALSDYFSATSPIKPFTPLGKNTGPRKTPSTLDSPISSALARRTTTTFGRSSSTVPEGKESNMVSTLRSSTILRANHKTAAILSSVLDDALSSELSEIDDEATEILREGADLSAFDIPSSSSTVALPVRSVGPDASCGDSHIRLQTVKSHSGLTTWKFISKTAPVGARKKVQHPIVENISNDVPCTVTSGGWAVVNADMILPVQVYSHPDIGWGEWQTLQELPTEGSLDNTSDSTFTTSAPSPSSRPSKKQRIAHLRPLIITTAERALGTIKTPRANNRPSPIRIQSYSPSTSTSSGPDSASSYIQSPFLLAVTSAKGVLAPAMCHCMQPDDGSQKVKCLGEQCPIEWFHYRCLDKGQKVSHTCHKNFTCTTCKLAAAPLKTKQNKQTEVEPQPPVRPIDDFKFDFSAAEILGAFTGPGPIVGAYDPYDLATRPPTGIVQAMEQEVGEDERLDVHGMLWDGYFESGGSSSAGSERSFLSPSVSD